MPQVWLIDNSDAATFAAKPFSGWVAEHNRQRLGLLLDAALVCGVMGISAVQIGKFAYWPDEATKNDWFIASVRTKVMFEKDIQPAYDRRWPGHYFVSGRPFEDPMLHEELTNGRRWFREFYDWLHYQWIDSHSQEAPLLNSFNGDFIPVDLLRFVWFMVKERYTLFTVSRGYTPNAQNIT